MHTLRDFADGLYAEAGAISFSDSYRHFRRYVELFKLPTAPVARAPLAAVFHLRGKRLEVKPGEAPDWPYELAAEERGAAVIALIQKYFATVETMGDPTAEGFDVARFAAWDRMTLAEFLKGQGASAAAVDLMSDSIWFGRGWSTGSALHRLVSDLGLFYLGQRTQVVLGGSDRLARAFADALRERIWYGAPVTEVRQEGDKVRAVFRQGGAEQAIEADRLVCTAPVPVVRKIRFTPELPAAKRRIVEQLEYPPVTRIYLQSRRRFWLDAGRAGNAATDLPIQLVAEHPSVRPEELASPRGLLECHVKFEGAARLDAMDPEARLALAVENLEKVHPGFRGQVEGGTSYSWGTDPWAGGGYAWWKPGQLTEWQPELARPEGRVHFAGDHTSLLSRTMEGALEFGQPGGAGGSGGAVRTGGRGAPPGSRPTCGSCP